MLKIELTRRGYSQMEYLAEGEELNTMTDYEIAQACRDGYNFGYVVSKHTYKDRTRAKVTVYTD